MLMLAIEGELTSAQHHPPRHWGGALHGFVEGAALAHAPHLLPLIRPNGYDGYSCLAIEPPPFDQPPSNTLRFGVILFRDASQAWAQLLRALLQQTHCGLHGHHFAIQQAWLIEPGHTALTVVTQGQLADPLPEPESPDAWVRRALPQPANTHKTPILHPLDFRSPLLLGGRGSIRRERAVPWPSLKTVLDSLAKRALALEPELARCIGLHPAWQADPALAEALPLTPAHQPARQVDWSYAPSRSIVKPGIVGRLMYATEMDAAAAQLLHWGQWLGVGQQTTLGCGRYIYTPQKPEPPRQELPS